MPRDDGSSAAGPDEQPERRKAPRAKREGGAGAGAPRAAKPAAKQRASAEHAFGFARSAADGATDEPLLKSSTTVRPDSDPTSGADAAGDVVDVDEPVVQLALPNGLRVQIHLDLPPDGYDLAVCSTDAAGNPGPLNEYVFTSAGLPLERLAAEFEHPFTHFENARGPDVLAVQTMGERGPGDRVWSTAARSLRAGLAPFVAPDGIGTIWLGAIGSGDAGLSLEDSLRLCLHTLGTLPGRGRFRVFLSLPSARLAEIDLVERLRSRPWVPQGVDLPLPLSAMEPHVARAVLVARDLAGSAAIDAAHLARAVCALVDDGRRSASTAFATFRGFLRVDPVTPDGHDSFPDRVELRLSPSLALAYVGLPDHVRKNGRLWGRDLVALLLLSRDPPLEDFARDAGTSVAALRDQWLAFCLADAKGHRSPEQWQDWWLDYGFRIDATVPRAGYLPELVDIEDHLEVDAEARALAGLIADVDVSPPLSIALLGDWGSGKSFFMDLIERHVSALSGQDGYCERAVPIRFNAWELSDANLWASLVDHIFEKLRAALWAHRGGEPTDAFEQELARAEGAVGEARRQLEDAQAELRAARAERDAKAKALREGFTLSPELRSAAQALGISHTVDAVADVERAIRELDAAAGGTRTYVRAILQRSSIRSGVLWALAALAVGAAISIGPALVGLRPDLTASLRSLGTIVGGIGAALGAMVAPLHRGASLLRDFNARLASEQERYRSALEGEQGISAARREFEVAESRLRTAEQSLGRIEAGGRAASIERGLRNFIQERANSEDYRALRGLISLVRRDFDKLGRMMKELRMARADRPADADVWGAGVLPVDRVVLYIDDLDRCRPERVVEVLEAIHLLLGLDLFAVVVAVDSRWMLRALEVHYEALLSARKHGADADFRDSTPQNYLEKIFQVPFALAPMSEEGFRRYVDFLVLRGGQRVDDLRGRGRTDAGTDAETGAAIVSLESQAPAQDAAAGVAAGVAGETAAARDGEGREARGDADRAPAADAADEGGQAPADGVWGTEREAGPPHVTITMAEQRTMECLGTLLPTPRQAKRLVNVFRLVKLRTLEDAPDAQACLDALVLLAILFGQPELARDLFRALYEQATAHDATPLHALLAEWSVALSRRPSAVHGARAMDARRVAAFLASAFPSLTVDRAAQWVARLARYSLVTGQDWHTWEPGPAITDRGER